MNILETWLDEIEYEIDETIDLEDKQIRKLAENSTSGVGTGTCSNVDVVESPEKTSNLGKPTNDFQNLVRKKKSLDVNAVPLSNADAANADAANADAGNADVTLPYEESSNPGKSAVNIQHLVRKKKLNDDDAGTEASAAKKFLLDDGSKRLINA